MAGRVKFNCLMLLMEGGSLYNKNSLVMSFLISLNPLNYPIVRRTNTQTGSNYGFFFGK